MKKILPLCMLLMAIATSAKAQFEQGTKYLSTSLSGLTMNYSSKANFQVGLNAEGGYFVEDYWMVRANFGFNHYAKNTDKFSVGVGARYYFEANGISLGAGLEYTHQSPNINDIRIPLEVGYTYYLNNYIAVEPAIFYKMSINDFSGGSELGLRLGLGYYF